MRANRVFLDTNTLLYAHDRLHVEKGSVVRNWLGALTDRDCARVNLQVLNEATNAMLRKRWFQSPLSVYDIIDAFAEWGDEPLGWAEIEAARSLHAAYGYSWWDCLLLASALELGCVHFLSEDLQDGHRIEAGGKALTIVSPFAHTPEEILSPQD